MLNLNLVVDSHSGNTKELEGLEGLENFIIEFVEIGSPLALCGLLAAMLYICPAVRAFAAASASTAITALLVLKLIRVVDQSQKNPPIDPDPDHATVGRTLGPYDRDMDAFWKAWKAPK